MVLNKAFPGDMKSLNLMVLDIPSNFTQKRVDLALLITVGRVQMADLMCDVTSIRLQ